MRLMLPFPPRALSPNVRVQHASEKWSAAREYKQGCYVLARQEYFSGAYPIEPPVSMKVTFILTSKRRRDYDNLIASFKAGQDALVLAGLIRDDNAWDLEVSYRLELGKQAGVRVELEAV